MATAHVLTLFGDHWGEHGSDVAVVVDGPAIESSHRAWLAGDLGMEVGFIDDVATASVTVFDAHGELPIAAQPVMAAAWLLRRLGTTPERINLPSTPVTVGASDDRAWVGIPLSAVPDRPRTKLADAEALMSLTRWSAAPGLYYWAWVDASAGIAHARWFDPVSGADVVTVAPTLRLAAELGAPITVQQSGAEIRVTPTADGSVVVEGRVHARDGSALPPSA